MSPFLSPATLPALGGPEPARRASATTDSPPDPLWYKDAVIYELHVKAYADSNGDGIGDLAGLTGRLDHLQSLGVNTLWLLPFYPSPLRDDGYDVADYEGVHPSYGTLADFRTFVAEAHRRGLRVITEMVMNHTSDQHPWFQRARRAPRGSAERDFYVWSDDPARYAGTRIIFTDTEKSNWSFDEVAGQYYWHRFFHHQPDLNFDNPAVLDAMFAAMEFWLEAGVDGFRLDAIPYLVEREGSSNENLRETHQVIRELRRRLEPRHPGALLLAEANMWPEDVREYFGDGDECHMAFHFPLMPRMYMAIAQEDRHPVVEILAQTPEIPANCQWAIFLRNHDELTLEMVTSQERDYMVSTYAADARARVNLGIRRRLAPLLQNDHARITLMNGLLLSLPGTPVLYYGDEIGMGDNIFLGDRDGVRTPMQWSSDRNGGFSRADPQRLVLPPIQDPVYGYEAVNVEAQAREPSSLLAWTRRMLAVRASSRAFGRGSFTMLHPGNRKVLAYLRVLGDEVILCVVNLSRMAQPVELALAPWKGRVPVEMMGHTSFAPITDQPYPLTLAGHGFFWFRLAADAAPPHWHAARSPLEDLPTLVWFDEWNSLFRQRVVPWRIALADKTRAQFESSVLPPFLQRQQWYGGRAEPPQPVTLAEHALLDAGGRQWLLALANGMGAGGTQRCFLPLAFAYDDDAARLQALGAAALCKVRRQARVGMLGDALADPWFCQALIEAVAAQRTVPGEGGSFHFSAGPALAGPTVPAPDAPAPVRRLTQGSHSISLVGDRFVIKAYRRLHSGVHPELEMGHHLTQVLGFAHCVAVAGSVQLQAADGRHWTLALLQPQVAHQGDAASLTLDTLVRTLQQAALAHEGAAPDVGPMEPLQLLGRRVAELHLALARHTGHPAFDPEPVRSSDLLHWAAQVREDCSHTLALIGRIRESGPTEAAAHAARIVQHQPALHTIIERAGTAAPCGCRIRLHGDLHLGQVLVCHNDFVFVDFEGEPQRSFAQRRQKHSAARDVASMLRSLDYVRHMALQQVVQTVPGDPRQLALLARRWERTARSAFLASYRAATRGSAIDPDGAPGGMSALLDLFELERALYELRYELEHRPDWIGVALAGIAAMTEA